jgi:hypothetical protein
LSIPAGIAGIAIGGMAGLGIALLIRFLPAMLREGTVARLILLCVLATALGGALFMAVVGGLVWLAGLVLPDTPTRVVATILSVLATPVAGPITFQLISGLPANFLPGGWRLPGWVYRVRRRRTAPEESRGPADLRGSASGKRD